MNMLIEFKNTLFPIDNLIFTKTKIKNINIIFATIPFKKMAFEKFKTKKDRDERYESLMGSVDIMKKLNGGN